MRRPSPGGPVPEYTSIVDSDTHSVRNMLMAVALTAFSVSMAPSAAADSTDLLRAAVAAARPAACPVRSDPVIDQAADEINKTTDRWINNTARAVPETNALPILKELGYGGSKASILSGASTSATNAIKATLIQAFSCSQTARTRITA